MSKTSEKTPEERLFEAIGNVDDDLLERFERDQPAAGARTRRRKRWTGITAGLAVAVAACLLIWNSIGQDFSPSYTATGTVINSATTELAAMRTFKLSTPANGAVEYLDGVERSLEEHQGQDVSYFVAITFYQDGNPLDVDSEQVQSELKRLQKLDYKVGYSSSWTYQGDMEKVNLIYPAGFFTAQQLQHFDANANYGYSFSFASNGDGSPVSAANGIFKKREDVPPVSLEN